MRRSLISLLSLSCLAAGFFNGCISTGSPLSEDEEGTGGTASLDDQDEVGGQRGDGDMGAGDGDMGAGDGDMGAGDGDMGAGDGDAGTGGSPLAGDGDMTVGDGDMTAGDGDGLGGSPGEISGLHSDDFSGSAIRGFWRFIEPQSGAYGSMKNDTFEIVLPGGLSREMWVGGARAPHLVQEGSFDDFYIEATFAGYPSRSTEAQGIIIKEDDDNFIRYEFEYNNGEEKFFLAALDGVSGAMIWGGREISYQGSAPRLRVLRQRNDWTFEYSFDGVIYHDKIERTRELNVTAVGVYVSHNRGDDGTTTLTVDDFRSLPLPE